LRASIDSNRNTKTDQSARTIPAKMVHGPHPQLEKAVQTALDILKKEEVKMSTQPFEHYQIINLDTEF
jgi:uncharacterized protein YqgV (UPF0045/DUF77 family)